LVDVGYNVFRTAEQNGAAKPPGASLFSLMAFYAAAR
jgi:hypothetical protein